MPQHLCTFSNKSKIEFDKGCFDSWCVFFTNANGKRYAPTDLQYFSRLKTLSQKYGSQHIYDDFVVVYNRTTKYVNGSVFTLIHALAQTYGEDALEVEIWLSVLYAGMVAEENKEKAILKKRIKRLGMYQLLIKEFEPEQAATFSKGEKWRELDKIMSDYGF